MGCGPRAGRQIAPIDRAGARLALGLRRDIERFVVKLGAERASLSHRNQALRIERVLREKHDTLTLAEFNSLDRRIDTLILAAAGEPFLAHTLRPLHTIYRRIGFIHHRYMPGHADLSGTIDCHLAILSAVANRRLDRAEAAVHVVIDLNDGIFLGRE